MKNQDVPSVSRLAPTDEGWPGKCDLCSAKGKDFLGVFWLCKRCRRRRLAKLEREIYPYFRKGELR